MSLFEQAFSYSAVRTALQNMAANWQNRSAAIIPGAASRRKRLRQELI